MWITHHSQLWTLGVQVGMSRVSMHAVTDGGHLNFEGHSPRQWQRLLSCALAATSFRQLGPRLDIQEALTHP